MIRIFQTYWIHLAAGVASLTALILFLLLVNDGNQVSGGHAESEIWNLDEQSEAPEQEYVSYTQLEEIVVDVKGAVQMPGVYTLEVGSRIDDAIRAAGGLTEKADSNQINFAMLLHDEMLIYAPEEGDESHASINMTNQLDSGLGSAQQSLVNINTATENELTTLNGIGPSKAASIISYREENGSFQTIEELTNVSGIGDKSFEKLKDEITVK
ncbi:helix-hairpin-helix domain-containing protein [Alkalicoccobacillus porphyridii]|uniref:Helix-hairpin-helix DNA-binding motif class 1 domain-containing protein n=1 Tax=Alkalicoccobacillus porphyridii TaxID=2597270 RepID=A0A553ZZF6_9BACI|nr:helix-hairpin-helix domain-containing protein [Alkalicoccobacillus porphyridii]TSB46786.1 hypothetical protein FN960_10610 [Alkalicoccobacillus porphyridii]